jgi:hypothetical protein
MSISRPKAAPAKRPLALGSPQDSPVPEVRSRVPKRVVRRADMRALQRLERVAERDADPVLAVQGPPIGVILRDGSLPQSGTRKSPA